MAREYDEKRKIETLAKLKTGFTELKSKYPKKRITKYALSKHTGVAKQTIDNYSQIVALLENEKAERYTFNTSLGKKVINSKKDVEKLITEYEKALNEKMDQNEKLIKKISSLDLKIVELTQELSRIKNIVKRYEDQR